ncbi:S9 family peptidase [Pasteurellaceae bacterium HPA106]|uniref:prolyl oligopeptidase family serine peptidase n=1 Tax=Spirabiliibacterium pneumoniae TaxID=221400 RepID=UPI001AACAA5E|nr:prolyl oligopeptidase family serine peptidase [Spirabiliibacterium pneumoniae]MBE2895667.1 S9 family peptidase [Spirabiliibacterium pneumoniae]
MKFGALILSLTFAFAAQAAVPDSTITQENAQTERYFADVEPLKAKLAQEMRGRIQHQSAVQTWVDGNYRYRKITAQRYPHFQRAPLGSDDWQSLVDGDVRGQNHAYYQLMPPVISPDGKTVAIAEDTQGRELYHIAFGKIAQDTWQNELLNTTGEIVWANNNQQWYYLQKDPKTNRILGLYLHTIGTPQHHDRLIYQERDPRFYLSLSRSQSKRYLLLDIAGLAQSETHVLDLRAKNPELTVFKPREANVEYYLDHANDGFYIRTNKTTPHFALFYAQNINSAWQLYYHANANEGETLESFTILPQWVVVKVRSKGLGVYRYWRKAAPDKPHQITFPDANYLARLQLGENTAQGILDFNYTAMLTPKTHLRYDLNNAQWLNKPTALDEDYHSEYTLITARDGTRVPVSLIYKSSLLKAQNTPVLLTAYGAYGFSFEPTFGTGYQSLLDRGFVYAIAHVRGGGELGVDWHEQGRKHHKRNSINDTVDVAQALAARFHTTHLYALGESAGALAIAGAINQAPTLFRAVVLQVPFVDVLSALNSPDGLGAQESEEWGDVNNPADVEYIKSYSPYQNIRSQPYPALFVVSGEQDTRVPLSDSVKFVNKLRVNSRSTQPILLSIERNSGHRHGLGRYARMQRNIDSYLFFLKQEHHQ